LTVQCHDIVESTDIIMYLSGTTTNGRVVLRVVPVDLLVLKNSGSAQQAASRRRATQQTIVPVSECIEAIRSQPLSFIITQ